MGHHVDIIYLVCQIKSSLASVQKFSWDSGKSCSLNHVTVLRKSGSGVKPPGYQPRSLGERGQCDSRDRGGHQGTSLKTWGKEAGATAEAMEDASGFLQLSLFVGEVRVAFDKPDNTTTVKTQGFRGFVTFIAKSR